MIRRLALLCLALLAPPLALAQEEADLAAAQSFVERAVGQGMALLSNEVLSAQEQEDGFQDFLAQNFAMRSIARFSIGRHWHDASTEQQATYERLFEAMIVRRYTAQFKDYQGQTVRVTGARPEGARDAVVASLVTQPEGQPAVAVEWRVRQSKDGGAWRVVDVIVEGVSMAQTYRAEFDSVVQRGGIPSLLAALEAQAGGEKV